MPRKRRQPKKQKQATRLKIAEWRELRGLTQAQLADKVGTTETSISRYETGERSPKEDMREAIAKALDIDLGDLYSLPSDPNPGLLLRGQPLEVKLQAMDIIEGLLKRNSQTHRSG